MKNYKKWMSIVPIMLLIGAAITAFLVPAVDRYFGYEPGFRRMLLAACSFAHKSLWIGAVGGLCGAGWLLWKHKYFWAAVLLVLAVLLYLTVPAALKISTRRSGTLIEATVIAKEKDGHHVMVQIPSLEKFRLELTGVEYDLLEEGRTYYTFSVVSFDDGATWRLEQAFPDPK